MGLYTYRKDVLASLLVHGLRPTEHTPPQLARDFVRDLYKYELRKLRESYVRGNFAKKEYAGRVVSLRNKYPVLALTARQWVT